MGSFAERRDVKAKGLSKGLKAYGPPGEAQRVGSARLQIRVALACPLPSQ